jgi:hypothetical protein
MRFRPLSEATEPAAVIAVLDAWFDRIAGPCAPLEAGAEVHRRWRAGDLPGHRRAGRPARRRCARSPPPAPAWRISMRRQARDCAAASARRCIGEIPGHIGAAKLDFTAIGAAVNWSAGWGVCRPLGRPMQSRARCRRDHHAPVPWANMAARHRGACAVFTLPDA